MDHLPRGNVANRAYGGSARHCKVTNTPKTAEIRAIPGPPAIDGAPPPGNSASRWDGGLTDTGIPLPSCDIKNIGFPAELNSVHTCNTGRICLGISVLYTLWCATKGECW